MKNHLSENAEMPTTIVNPPPVQEMNSNQNQASAPSAPPSKDDNSTGMELQPI